MHGVHAEATFPEDRYDDILTSHGTTHTLAAQRGAVERPHAGAERVSPPVGSSNRGSALLARHRRHEGRGPTKSTPGSSPAPAQPRPVRRRASGGEHKVDPLTGVEFHDVRGI
jgi:hypothetical protein